MSKVSFTSNLKRFHPTLSDTELDANTISEMIEKIEEKFPGLKAYIVDEQKSLRQHVNIFINDNMIRDRINLSDTISKSDIVFIMQALSGG